MLRRQHPVNKSNILPIHSDSKATDKKAEAKYVLALCTFLIISIFAFCYIIRIESPTLDPVSALKTTDSGPFSVEQNLKESTKVIESFNEGKGIPNGTGNSGIINAFYLHVYARY
jgi:hypothetical protein